MSTKKYIQNNNNNKKCYLPLSHLVGHHKLTIKKKKKKKKKKACIDKQIEKKKMYPHQPSGPAKESKEGIIALPLT